MTRLAFRFSRWHRLLGLPFGVTPTTTVVDVADGRLVARFGPWVVETPLENIDELTETGPYGLLKTAGPARLSLVDKGLTMATTQERGVCIRFRSPVRGIDPFGLIRHPGLTVTVDGVDELRRAIDEPTSTSGTDAPTANAPGRSPWSSIALWVRWPPGMALAAARYIGAWRGVERSTETRVDPPPPPTELDETAGLQQLDEGVGPAFERIYRVVIGDTALTPEELFDQVASDLNKVLPTEVAQLLTMGSTGENGEVGQQFSVRTPGPWEAAVRVLDRTPRSLRFATLDGHMEAGEIEFSTRPAAEEGRSPIIFEIRSVARSGDRRFDLLYRVLSVGRQMQEYMWVHTCERVAAIASGEQLGPITVHTIRYAR